MESIRLTMRASVRTSRSPAKPGLTPPAWNDVPPSWHAASILSMSAWLCSVRNHHAPRTRRRSCPSAAGGRPRRDPTTRAHRTRNRRRALRCPPCRWWRAPRSARTAQLPGVLAHLLRRYKHPDHLVGGVVREMAQRDRPDIAYAPWMTRYFFSAGDLSVIATPLQGREGSVPAERRHPRNLVSTIQS